MAKRKSGIQQTRGEATKEKATGLNVRQVVTFGLIVVASGALAALAISSVLAPQVERATKTPEAWEYDPVANRHWHPDHAHWHPGPPPSVFGDGVEPPPYIPNPQPWQYDEATDRHFDPGHGHWHSGPPPEGVDANTLVSPVRSDRVDPPPGITNPTPWQYDPVTDRHYHTPHQHWHAGPPPPPDQR